MLPGPAVPNGRWPSWVLPAGVRTRVSGGREEQVGDQRRKQGGLDALSRQGQELWCKVCKQKARPNPRPLSGHRKESESGDQEEA